jgi:hypothetical protein
MLEAPFASFPRPPRNVEKERTVVRLSEIFFVTENGKNSAETLGIGQNPHSDIFRSWNPVQSSGSISIFNVH